MKRSILIVLTLGAVVLGTAAFAWDNSDGAYGPPGSQLVLGSEKVAPEKVGRECTVAIDIGNNDSVRPGSDIAVTTGSSSVLFPNSEGVKGDPGPVFKNMVMGDTITATLTFGPNHEYDGSTYDNAAFSGMGSVEVGDCVPPPDEPVCMLPEDCTEEPPPVTPPKPPTLTPPPPAAVVAVPKTTG